MAFVDEYGRDDWIHAEILGEDFPHPGDPHPPVPKAPRFPRFDWVYRCDLVLGEVAPGERNGRYMGKDVSYRPWPNLWSGARWCSAKWLKRPDIGLRGPLIRHQGGTARFPMRIRGVATGGTVVVVPDDQIETAAGVAADLIARRAHDAGHGVGEWSMALLRRGSRTRMAVGFASLTDGARERLRAELDVEWFLSYREAFGDRNDQATYDHFRIETPDGAFSRERNGLVHHDNEAVSRRLVEIADRHGNGLELRLKPTRSPGELIHNASYRPLEPDELDDDHDLSEWMGTSEWPGRDEPAKPRKRRTRRK